MGLFKKKQPKAIEKEEPFRIPQVTESDEGLITSKPKFSMGEIGSVFFGSQVKDKVVYSDNQGSVNVDSAYDAFRSEEDKHIKEEELLRKYGSKYPEFSKISNKEREKLFGVKYEAPIENKKEIVEPKKKKLGFSFVEEIDQEPSIKEEPKSMEPVLEQKTINLDINFDDEYEYNSFDPKLEEPKASSIPSFLFKSSNEETKKEEPVVIEKPISVDKPLDLEKPIQEIVYDDDKPKVEEAISSPKAVSGKYDNYRLPPLDIFKKSGASSDEVPAWLEEKKDIINDTLKSFDVEGEVVNYTKGPAFTRYEIMLAAGQKVARVKSLHENFQMNLGVKSIRILAPIPGKKTVGIEVPNDKTEMVCFGDIITDDFIKSENKTMVMLGKDIDGNPISRCIDDMPHCLVAGATKSGKSVCMSTILISLLLKNKPDELKLILVDPKQVEFSFYTGLPHLITPIITDASLVPGALKWAVEEMERRYQVLNANRVRNIGDYNKKAKAHPELSLEKLPYIIIVIDELADLMTGGGAEIEDNIKRITAKARAAGIHMVVATQRPTVQVVSGNIKGNIPTRIAFRVAAYVDSNTILDEGGAENLLGKGDMLIKDIDAPQRVQGAFVSDDEITEVCDFICNEAAPDYVFTHDQLKKSMENTQIKNEQAEAGESDELLYDVASFCVNSKSCSINGIQQQFNFGFNRAQRIVAILEQKGIVSEKKPGNTSNKGREILVDMHQLNLMFGRGDDDFE